MQDNVYYDEAMFAAHHWFTWNCVYRDPKRNFGPHPT